MKSIDKGEYQILLQRYPLAYSCLSLIHIFTASESGKLVSGSNELAFTNALETGNLTKSGDTLDGTVTVTDDAANPGKYTGTIDFTINYYKGE